MHRSLALIPIAFLIACGGEAPAEAPDASTVDAAPSPDAFPQPGLCSSTTYQLGSITCWDSDLSTSVTLDDFVAAAADSTMRFMLQLDDTCSIELRFEGDTCAEDQRWLLSGRGSEYTSAGITSCAPDGCNFGAADDACAVGEHAATAIVQIAVVLDVGDVLLTFDGATGVCADLGYDIEEQHWRVPR
jgi:hypothetical protein